MGMPSPMPGIQVLISPVIGQISVDTARGPVPLKLFCNHLLPLLKINVIADKNINSLGSRKDRAFMAINRATLPPSWLL
jgi:hypothetical protein